MEPFDPRLLAAFGVTTLQHLNENELFGEPNYLKKVEHAFATSMVVMWREGSCRFR
jgi:hypothetical protein